MDNRMYVSINNLIPWEKNPRSINQDDYEKLKSKLETMEQIKPLLVTPNDDGTYTVLGGNMRLRAYKELGVENVWVSSISFTQDPQGLWRAEVNGKEAAKRFNTKQDAMMEYALLDNDRSGYYDADLLANLLPDYSVDWNQYAVDLETPQSIQELLDKVAPEPEPEKEDPTTSDENKDFQVECPLCGHKFNAADHPAGTQDAGA